MSKPYRTVRVSHLGREYDILMVDLIAFIGVSTGTHCNHSTIDRDIRRFRRHYMPPTHTVPLAEFLKFIGAAEHIVTRLPIFDTIPRTRTASGSRW